MSSPVKYAFIAVVIISFSSEYAKSSSRAEPPRRVGMLRRARALNSEIGVIPGWFEYVIFGIPALNIALDMLSSRCDSGIEWMGKDRFEPTRGMIFAAGGLGVGGLMRGVLAVIFVEAAPPLVPPLPGAGEALFNPGEFMVKY